MNLVATDPPYVADVFIKPNLDGDLAVVKHGEGTMALSMLRIVENLGKDPVADKLLFNMLDWTVESK